MLNECSEGSWAEFNRIKNEVLQRIQSLAQQSDTGGLIKTSDWLRGAVSIEKRYEAICEEARDVIRRGLQLVAPEELAPTGFDNSNASETQQQNSAAVEASQGGKARGRECRCAHVSREAERGRNLKRFRGALYRNEAGLVVGIPYSAEDGVVRDRWFLGLPAEKFQEADLLCESASGKIQVIKLPSRFIERYGGHLSISKRYRQAKFRIDRRDGRYVLGTSLGSVDVTEFVDPDPLDCPPCEFE